MLLLLIEQEEARVYFVIVKPNLCLKPEALSRNCAIGAEVQGRRGFCVSAADAFRGLRSVSRFAAVCTTLLRVSPESWMMCRRRKTHFLTWRVPFCREMLAYFAVDPPGSETRVFAGHLVIFIKRPEGENRLRNALGLGIEFGYPCARRFVG